MSDKAVVTCAITGVLTNPKQHPVPVTVEQMAASAKEAFDAVDADLLAELGLSKNPDDILNAGIFQSEIQGEGNLQEMFDEVKAGL